MEKKIIYGGESRPHFESNFEILLNFVLRSAYKIVKRASFFAQRIIPTGIDGKTTIKE